MPVSEEMVEEAQEMYSETITFNEFGVSGCDFKKQAQAVVNAAWKAFDPNDESTWPDEGRYFIYNRGLDLWREGFFIKGKFKVVNNSKLCEVSVTVTDYADPQHLTLEVGDE